MDQCCCVQIITERKLKKQLCQMKCQIGCNLVSSVHTPLTMYKDGNHNESKTEISDPLVKVMLEYSHNAKLPLT